VGKNITSVKSGINSLSSAVAVFEHVYFSIVTHNKIFYNCGVISAVRIFIHQTNMVDNNKQKQ